MIKADNLWMTYRGYWIQVRVYQEFYYGTVYGIKDLILCDGKTLDDFRACFQSDVDYYIAKFHPSKPMQRQYADCIPLMVAERNDIIEKLHKYSGSYRRMFDAEREEYMRLVHKSEYIRLSINKAKWRAFDELCNKRNGGVDND